MKKTFKSYLLGFLTATVLLTSAGYAANVVKIVIDGTEITPRDVNGKRVDPIIIDGTTYLPVRAVAQALGKEVYWDGPNYTVYLGKMNGNLEYPTVEMRNLNNISEYEDEVSSYYLKDNYGNSYSYGYRSWLDMEYLLNMKYSRFKATLYVPEGESDNVENSLEIYADGKRIYSSPKMTKTSSPVKIDLNVTGCNDFQIKTTATAWNQVDLILADAGFYQ